MSGDVPVEPAPEPAQVVLRGLDAATAQRPAAEVLAEVAWDGGALDPVVTPAGEFLALL